MPNIVKQDERGQVIIFFALLIPILLGLGAITAGVGNWFVHGKHLQTKADSGALAGGLSWGFPCGTQVDTRIANTARAYAGATNPQVGGVPDTSVKVRLNASNWYDDDSNQFQGDFDSPSGSVCNAMVLDVKTTEDNSFPLASLIPLFPDIKRKARIEIREVESAQGLLPIAMRAPVPVSAAVFYDETDGDVLGVKYFVKNGSIVGLPAGLQGWSTDNIQDPSTWARFNPGHRTGVAIAISYRGACNTGLPNPNDNIPVQQSGPCFEDNFSKIDGPGGLCNQGTTQIQIVDCYYATGTHPSQVMQAGLHFIRGYADTTPTTSGPPVIENAYLENVSCISGSYFNWQRTPSSGTDCLARLRMTVDVGPLIGEYGAPGPPGNGPLHDEDIQVRYRLVRGDGSSTCNYGNTCSLNGNNGQGPTLTYETTGGGSEPHLLLRSNSQQNAVAIEIQIKNSTNHTNANCRGNGFSNNCRWYITGDGVFGTSVPPTDVQILAEPIQRSFRGNTTNASSVQWLRLTQDANCDNGADTPDPLSASALADGCAGFRMEMGLKGGIAQDADEPPTIFNDGVASSKTGILHCDPAVSNGQSPEDSVRDGCAPWYAPHSFDPIKYATSGLCPDHNNIFQLPNPGPPWDDWPPLTCVKTRNTSANQQMEKGLRSRFFGGPNVNTCPSDAAGFVKGRNYWDVANNPLNAANPDPDQRYGYKDDGPPARDSNFHPADPRLVTIFLVPTYAVISDGGEKTYPITGFVQVYITGFADLQNGGALRNGTTDPCPGNTPPPVSERDCQGVDCGFVAWGHIVNWVIPSAGTTPSTKMCDPQESTQPCVPVLVE